MVTMPKGPKAWKVEQPAALQRADLDAWLYPVESVTFEVELRDEFLKWASKRPADLRWIRRGSYLFRRFIEEFTKTPEGQLRVLEIGRRRYQLAYEEDYEFPGWSREKSLQMLRNIDRQIMEVRARMSRGETEGFESRT